MNGIKILNLIDINIRAVKSGDINNSHVFTNGLSSYEFCTLSRFAGLSSNLDLISFSSPYQSSSISSLISEGIWYAIDGMNNVRCHQHLSSWFSRMFGIDIDTNKIKSKVLF